ncbi:uncharacterized protein A1O9_03642 [Exophiala aquamarina CBS 119918]|uniref:PWWP domain-containing protein n=1 Tax=Exophiala aquamarina CBS 119918 TaxID=1182545 RepID=A0A072PFD6_9EURO|nr:uncharacterized protein A1O9_03642 [Exophiala aquamarina CBS 119918]KEF58799.1 hypothetical protein A1O9_03642 [Exophiala aquamarina CBS 119918]
MADSEPAQTKVPVNVPEPQDDAPPSLAEPASGPAAEMSGALPVDTSSEAKPTETTGHVTANGAVDSAPENTKDTQEIPTEVEAEPPVATEPEAKDAEVAEAAEKAEEAKEAEPEANGTPAGKKPVALKRKSSAGIPEHKGKKLNKKKSMTKITHLDAQPGEYYLARLKSYPPWPSIVCDEEMLPESLLSTRPVTTKKDDGTYNEAYADGGKKVADRTFPIMFLHTNEFAWIPNTDLTPLNPEDCKDVPEKGKAKALSAAYKVAAENNDLEHFKTLLDEHAAALQADIEAKEARDAEKAAKSDKKKRKSEAKIETEDVDMEDADAEPVAKKGSKKRKKEVDSDDEESEKPAKTPKTTKIKLNTNKTPKTEEKKPKEKAPKAKPEKRKSKAAPVSDEEMVDAEPEPEEKPLDPAEARKAREKEVLFLRHKLQKGFLSRDQAPQEDEMPQMSTYIKKLEGYADLEVAIIRTTKINKVLKALIKLNTIPRDEEYQFRKRSLDLLSQWNKIMGAEPADNEAGTAGDKESKYTPTTNGVHDEKSEEPADEKKDDPTEQPAKPIDKPVAETESEISADPVEVKPVAGESEPATTTEEPKAVLPTPEVIEKAPESAAAASEAADVVKATE